MLYFPIFERTLADITIKIRLWWAARLQFAFDRKGQMRRMQTDSGQDGHSTGRTVGRTGRIQTERKYDGKDGSRG